MARLVAAMVLGNERAAAIWQEVGAAEPARVMKIWSSSSPASCRQAMPPLWATI